MNLNEILCIKIQNLPKRFSSQELVAIFAEFNQVLVCPDVSDFHQTFGSRTNFGIIYAGSYRQNASSRGGGYDWLEIGSKSRYLSPTTAEKLDFLHESCTWYLRVPTHVLDTDRAQMDGFKIVFELQSYSGLINTEYSFVVPENYNLKEAIYH